MDIAPSPSKIDSLVSKEDILHDYRIACESRHASLFGRKEVFAGKATFGIFGDGKEVAQVAAARFFQNGDWRSGYYRDQTFMMHIGGLTIEQYFAQLYAYADKDYEPASAGRQMTSHFATRYLDDNGNWISQTNQKNSSADISPTASQMPRLLGLAAASKIYRNDPNLKGKFEDFSINGNEVAFGMIGNASVAEGMFFETLNAAGVMQVPLVMSVWDDGYGISVPNKYQTVKGDISKILAGLQRNEDGEGYEIFRVKGWDYEALIETYNKAVSIAREYHIPCLVHVLEMTQPQGHSTSGSHTRYKSKERLSWEEQYDPITKMGEWIVENGYASQEEIDAIDKASQEKAKTARKEAWKAYQDAVKQEHSQAEDFIRQAHQELGEEALVSVLKKMNEDAFLRRENAMHAVRKTLRYYAGKESEVRDNLLVWLERNKIENADRYNSHLHSESDQAATLVAHNPAEYDDDAKEIEGFMILNNAFDAIFEREPRAVAFGEDLGKIGDVNQGFRGLQEKYGELRISDTGIHEIAIMGRGIGMAMRGLRPIAEIQYLDYILYALQIISDDLASLQYRTKGGQKAPVIIRTRGHRLEGIWHAGSPLGALINSFRGVHLLVPRNMTQAAGFYNTLMMSDEPAVVIECLNGYRLKEKLPSNLSEFTLPLGVPEILREGKDITIVTYGSMCRIVMNAAEELAHHNIDCEVIDVQTLLPFDRHHSIVESLKKTNRLLVADEDFEGGATAYMLQKIVEEQNGYVYLDSKPATIAAHPHRPAYSTDGDYFSKPNADDIFEKVYAIMREANPDTFGELF